MSFNPKSLAYLCFLPPTVLSVVGTISSFVRLDPGMAGGIGFLVLIPLALLSLFTVPKGFVLTWQHADEWPLWVLAILVVVAVIVTIFEIGPPVFQNAVMGVHGGISLALIIQWFGWRRKSSRARTSTGGGGYSPN